MMKTRVFGYNVTTRLVEYLNPYHSPRIWRNRVFVHNHLKCLLCVIYCWACTPFNWPSSARVIESILRSWYQSWKKWCNLVHHGDQSRLWGRIVGPKRFPGPSIVQILGYMDHQGQAQMPNILISARNWFSSTNRNPNSIDPSGRYSLEIGESKMR